MCYLEFIERFQTLIAGVLAVMAAFGTAIAIYRSAHAPIKAEHDRRAEEARARGRAHALALLVDIQDLSDKAYHIKINVLGGPADPNVPFKPDVIPKERDGWCHYFHLGTPASLQDWNLAAAHPSPIPSTLKNLSLTLRRYEWYINTREDWDDSVVLRYIEKIRDASSDLISAIENEYSLTIT